MTFNSLSHAVHYLISRGCAVRIGDERPRFKGRVFLKPDGWVEDNRTYMAVAAVSYNNEWHWGEFRHPQHGNGSILCLYPYAEGVRRVNAGEPL